VSGQPIENVENRQFLFNLDQPRLAVYIFHLLNKWERPMTRVVRDEKIKGRGDRAKLHIRYAPYWCSVDEHLHIGYRKGPKGGRWLSRTYQGNGKYKRNQIGVADDNITGKADGVTVLSFDQAANLARKLDRQPVAGPLTVGEAFNQYVESLNPPHKRTARQSREARTNLELHVPRKLFDKPVAKLTQDDVASIRDGLVKMKPEEADDPEMQRRKKATANRVMATVKAALNKAYKNEDNQIPSNTAWRRVENFKRVIKARDIFLNAAEQRRLINASKGAFRNFVIACLLTGLRPPHELGLLRVRDFDAPLRMLTLRAGKTGHRNIVLTPEAVDFFRGLAAGRAPDSPLLPKDDGKAWTRNEHIEPMRAAVKRAKLPDDCTAYTLRHSHASLAIRNGMSLKLLAENMGTSVAMLERHYVKFTLDDKRQLVAQAGPELGLSKGDKTTSIAT